MECIFRRGQHAYHSAKAQAEDCKAQGTPDRAVAKVGALWISLDTLVKQLPGTEADGNPQRQCWLGSC